MAYSFNESNIFCVKESNILCVSKITHPHKNFCIVRLQKLKIKDGALKVVSFISGSRFAGGFANSDNKFGLK